VVISRKVDLDTVTAAYVLGVSPGIQLVVVPGRAASEDLRNPNVLCIEAGGSGQTHLGNFDHHGFSGPIDSAAMQAWQHEGSCPSLEVLVKYVDALDTGRIDRGHKPEQGDHVTLSYAFAGMLLCKPEPSSQFWTGLEMIERLLAQEWDPAKIPAGCLPAEWQEYVEAKAQNDALLQRALATARWFETRGRRRAAAVETEHFGAVGALYQKGADVVVALHPWYGTPPAPKFTIAGNGVAVTAVLPELNRREPGWGGPATGTIIGSPREGTRLNFEEVIELVKDCL